MREQFLNDPEDLAWLRDVHVGDIKIKFESAIIHGNEDAPEKIELYAAVEPLVTDLPVAIIIPA